MSFKLKHTLDVEIKRDSKIKHIIYILGGLQKQKKKNSFN